MPTYKVYLIESDYMPGSQAQATDLPSRFLGTVTATSKLAGKNQAMQKWPDEQGRFVLEATTPVSAYLSEIGQRGGSKTSDAKAEAARRNGQRGGRPRKTQEEE